MPEPLCWVYCIIATAIMQKRRAKSAGRPEIGGLENVDTLDNIDSALIFQV